MKRPIKYYINNLRAYNWLQKKKKLRGQSLALYSLESKPRKTVVCGFLLASDRAESEPTQASGRVRSKAQVGNRVVFQRFLCVKAWSAACGALRKTWSLLGCGLLEEVGDKCVKERWDASPFSFPLFPDHYKKCSLALLRLSQVEAALSTAWSSIPPGTMEALDQEPNYIFLLISRLSQVFSHSDGKLMNTDTLQRTILHVSFRYYLISEPKYIYSIFQDLLVIKGFCGLN